ncbi:TM1802 family CRISPR-associated protein [Algoriphagus sp. NG3]|uniref:TM1802 family CRISPR-associated protein n=1 Tax=Algoriphagus sp. NG3 TaxID=3097546 RepID=UPI002A8081F7|nr:TM1802 family CRISPR-associated protein [Algoriphagus sp. NG3]WPR77954.1 TM1802 family CRISPR-associated protein [Algoriphagus sp. NG3]
MLSTLVKIGEQLLDGKGIWAQLTSEPKYSDDKTNWVCPILFDCENGRINILKDQISRFKPEDSSIKFRYLNTELWGRRGKKCALTVEPKNFAMLEETLFGKTSGEAGTMTRTIDEYPQLVSKSIYAALLEIQKKLNSERAKLDMAEFKKELSFGKDDEAVLFYSVIKSAKINNGQQINLIELDGYDEFVLEKFGTQGSGQEGIDYVTGNNISDVQEANFSGRYNIHKIFQTTASNYASGFADFRKNFQTNQSTIAALDKASEYALSKLQTRIAGITHIVIPNFLHKDLDELDIEETELFLDRSSELLFKYSSLEADVERELPDTDLFWLNYIAFESDGNSFKVMNHIKDVNSKYLKKLTEVFASTEGKFRSYIGGKLPFNFQSVYYMIPSRDSNKSKNNPALHLFKDILEQRKIESAFLFRHFTNLALCHWYGRYAAFPNIRKNDSFDFAIKDAVFKYSALIYALKKLNIVTMENKESEPLENQVQVVKSDFQQRIDNFFEKMEYGTNEKTMFYLGRILSSIAYAQYKKGHESKPVMNKINFNGMDVQSIIRLSLDLSEKVRQYNLHRETEGNFARFRENFNEKQWNMSSEQNVFYLMAGYSFGLTKSDNN